MDPSLHMPILNVYYKLQFNALVKILKIVLNAEIITHNVLKLSYGPFTPLLQVIKSLKRENIQNCFYAFYNNRHAEVLLHSMIQS